MTKKWAGYKQQRPPHVHTRNVKRIAAYKSHHHHHIKTTAKKTRGVSGG
jgi:IS1 family transposase